MKDYDKIAHKIQEIEPQFTDEVLNLLYEYFEAKKATDLSAFLETEKASNIISGIINNHLK